MRLTERLFNDQDEEIMSIPFGFTTRQLQIWGLRRAGLRQSDIGRRLGISRQAIHKILRFINGKVKRNLEATARAAKIEIHRVDPEQGILLGFSHETKNHAIVTFSTQHGVHIWHYFTGQCEGCDLHKNCRDVIFDEAVERGIVLSEAIRQQDPSDIAHHVVTHILSGLDA